jgi:hypothetical protein
MKTRMNILTLACALTCFSCIGTAHTIQPSKNYQTEKRSLGDIREVSTLSSIDVVYHQTPGNTGFTGSSPSSAGFPHLSVMRFNSARVIGMMVP